MKTLLGKSILAAAAATLASTALAQDAPPGQAPPQPAPAPDQQAPGEEAAPEVTESQLDTFTTIYVDLQTMNTEFQEELSEVETQEEAREIQARLQEDSIALIEEHGWSVDRYNQVADAIDTQPDVLERAFELIDEKS
jgi:hypothetical protein